MKRRWLLGGVIGLVVLLVTALAVVAPPDRVAGEAVAADPAAVAGDALDQLADLGDIELTGWVGTTTAQRLQVDIVATREGVRAVVEDSAGGTAEFVVAGDQAAVKADGAWWLNTVPAHQQAFSGKWVRADDDMGFPVSALAGLSGRAIHALVTARAGADWSATPVVFLDGSPALALSPGADDGWRVYVTPTRPARLLGIGGPLLADVDRVAGQAGPAFPDVDLAVTTPGTGCRDQTGKNVAETAPTIPDLPRPEVPALDERPMLTGSVLAGGVCSTPVCPFTVQIVNVGNAPGVGTVMITSSAGPPMTAPLNLPPNGGRFSTVYTVRNPAPPSPNGRIRVPITVQAFAQVTSLAGPDVDAGKRLNDRGVDPNNPVPGRPAAMGPGVTDILDGLTRKAPVLGLHRQDVVADAQRLLGDALDAGLTELLRQLVHSPALRYAADPARTPLVPLFETAAKGKPAEQEIALRTIKVLLALAKGRPAPPSPDSAPLHVEDGVILDDAGEQAYVITGLRGGLKGQAGVDGLYDRIHQARELLDRVAPDGFAKAVEVDVRGAEAGTLGGQSRSQLRDVLRDGTPHGRSFRDVLLDDQGRPALNALSIVSPTSGLPGRGGQAGAFVFDHADLVALGQTKDENMPAVPPASTTPHFTPATRKHTFEGDAYDSNDKTGGGHSYGVGAPDKTEFPKSWPREVAEPRIVEVVDRAIANKQAGNEHDGKTDTASGTSIRPDIENKNQMGVPVNSWKIRGTSNGVELEITVLQDGTIVTAYPTGQVANADGLLQPYVTIADPANPDLPFLNPKPPGKPKAELPSPGGSPGAVKRYAVTETQRPQYVRAGPDGRPQWVHRGQATPGGKDPVHVVVVRDGNGRHEKTTETTPPRPADPPPAVCRPAV